MFSPGWILPASGRGTPLLASGVPLLTCGDLYYKSTTYENSGGEGNGSMCKLLYTVGGGGETGIVYMTRRCTAHESGSLAPSGSGAVERRDGTGEKQRSEHGSAIGSIREVEHARDTPGWVRCRASGAPIPMTWRGCSGHGSTASALSLDGDAEENSSLSPGRVSVSRIAPEGSSRTE